MNLKYKKKYNRLKRCVKNCVVENSSVGDVLCFLQAELAAGREERMYLIERLMFHEGLERNPLPRNNFMGDGDEALFKKKIGTRNKSTTLMQKKKNSMFPINLNNLLVHSLGEIIPVNPNFHCAYWIYPVGYVATRIYAHPKDPRKKCVFTCKILNNAGIPQFQIIPDNDLDSVFFGETASACHEGLLKAIQQSLKDSVKLSFDVKGELFFGLSNIKIQSLIKGDPGFKFCANFRGFDIHRETNLFEDQDPSLCFEALQLLINNSLRAKEK
ncbi:transforming growth factor beta regulator 1 [Scaptodrosophila lebanonensis]|uniref:Transforming growth factor beta regulator 1 n=1 Tax=Drosophila lebanonensis TaxID=7225 RepID=A0A6J2U2E7_DROLE|nr:transforming growth factor beta regulator 1 [Scaptodrosophila lebanonensis]